ncbi:MAG: hypothetical protein ACRC92_11360 [Peptostreptococcaceae bacterium]
MILEIKGKQLSESITEVSRLMATEHRDGLTHKAFRRMMFTESVFMTPEMFAEAKFKNDEEKTDAQFPMSVRLMHLSFNKIATKSNFPAYKDALTAGGDITRVNGYRELKECLTKTQKIDPNSKYIKTLARNLKYLESKKTEFSKVFKTDTGHPIRDIWICNVLAIYMSVDFINRSACMVLTGGAKNIDDHINSKKHQKWLMDLCQPLFESEAEITKLVKADLTDKNKKNRLMVETALPLEYLAEANVVSIATVFKFGMAKALYTLLAPVRYLIYLGFRTRYSFEKTLQDTRDLLGYYQTDSGMERDRRIDSIKNRNRDFDIALSTHIPEVKKEVESEKKASASEAEAISF